MSAQSDSRLTEFGDWTLRERPASAEPARLLLLVHGWTGDENSMWVFVRRFPPRYWLLAPRAPFRSREGGYSWRESAGAPGGLPTFESLAPAAERLIELVDQFSGAHKIPAQEFDAIGFSQGAAVVNALAFLFPNRVGRLGILAGFVPAGAEGHVQTRVLESKPFFVAHGTQDQRVDIEEARQSARLLEQAGARVTYCEDAVGHKVSANCLRSLEAFFA